MEITREGKLGCIGTYASSCFFLSFCLPFVDLFRGDIKYEETPGPIILANYFNCFMWYYYGDMIDSSPIKVNYLACYITSAILLIIYLGYEFREYKSDAVLNFLIIAVLTFIIWKLFKIFDDDDDKVFYGCLIGNVLVYLSPIQILYKVVKELNYHLVPIYSAFISLIGCCVWTLYAFNTKGFTLLAVPNVLGILMSIIQIFVWKNYRKKTADIIGVNNTSTVTNVEEVGDSDTKKIHRQPEGDNNDSQIIGGKPVKIVSSEK